ncbi:MULTISPECIES: hypothetical protein [unclassified Sphingomonas]|uniref:hypothetical protein n=1 Tax=unclassified Sphingomonas TaxID=196159 RepID=UPI000E107E04|nr:MULTISPECIES: hypothetical protein [unclassified Sphingomonas]AXJ96391.1 hypothetical protein DM480_13745 [Sphingomonas sp. FARSPH]
MVAIVSVLIFAGALALSFGVIVATIAPKWQRIVRMMDGHVEPAFTPLAHIASVERRIAIRRWASTSAPTIAHRSRAAA